MAESMSASGKLRSEQVVVQSPLSFVGSAKRIWKITDQENDIARYALMVLAVALIVIAWSFVVVWYCIWGIFLIPYRLLRRGSRKDKVRALQHREQLQALTNLQQQQAIQTSQMIHQNQKD